MPAVAAVALPDHPCYLNGDFTTLPHAKVSVLDRGFIFGDGVYEVVPAYGARLFTFERHMARLDRSLGELRMTNPLTHAAWHGIATDLIANCVGGAGANGQNGLRTEAWAVYIQVTRGVAMRDHVMPDGIVPTVFAMATPMKQPSEQARRDGVACISADDFRWMKGHIKSTSLLGAVFARQLSADAGATETILFRDGVLTEASASNVWVVKDGAVAGAPNDARVLEGIRYGLLQTLCADAGIAFSLRRIERDEVFAADELLLSSATKEVLPVTRLDGRLIGSGRPGPVYAALYAGYQAAKAHGA